MRHLIIVCVLMLCLVPAVATAEWGESDLCHEDRTDQEECEWLLNFLLPFADDQLAKNGSFIPFGAVLKSSGDAVATAAASAEAAKGMDILIHAHREMASNGEIRASGIAYIAEITLEDGRKTDAVVFCLEHSSGYSVAVLQPYSFDALNRFIPEDLLAHEGMHRIFADGQPSFSTAGFGYVIATKMLVEKRCPVRFMYREAGEGDDSGWRFFCGDEDQAYCDNPDNLGIYSIDTILGIDPSVLPCLDSPAGSAYERMTPDSPFVKSDFGFAPEDE